MTEAENIDRVVKALEKVPETRLLIIELANTLPLVNGEFDYYQLADKKLEINLAIAEAKSYGTHTIMAVDSLVRLRASEEE